MNKINISIDDVSPHPMSSIDVVDKCFNLINVFPDIKFTLFVPIAHWRTMVRKRATPHPLVISKYPKFCEKIKNLPKNNFEIGYHGYYHGIPYKNDNDEFADLNYQKALEKFNLMKSVVAECDLESTFSPIFRPPAWRMSPGSFRASSKAGIKHLAIFPIKFKKYGWNQANTYKNEDKKDIYNVSYASCFPPFKNLELKANTNIVYHACKWDKNYLSDTLSESLKSFLLKNEGNFEFSFN
jgi:hypothetical protein